MFETGRIAMTTCGRWCNTNYRRVLDFEYDAVPFPVGPSGEVTAFPGAEDCSFSGWSGSVGLGIIKGSKGEQYAEQAYRFIEFIAGAEGQTEQAALGFQIPNQIELAHTDVFLQPDQPPANAEVFIEAARCQLPGPWVQTPLHGEWFGTLWWDEVWPAVVVDDTMFADEALEEYADEFQARLDDAWSTLD
jgi:multiple sugar transport system substrate-binding protein